MQFLNENWPFLLIAAGIALILIVLLRRPRQRVELKDSGPVRPHMASAANPARASGASEGRGLAAEAAAATSDVAGELIGAPVHPALAGSADKADDFVRLKGVGPKFAAMLNGLGFVHFDQLASLTPEEVARLDPQLGAFRGRLARDRIVEQAGYLARGDIDSYEQRFGKL